MLSAPESRSYFQRWNGEPGAWRNAWSEIYATWGEKLQTRIHTPQRSFRPRSRCTGCSSNSRRKAAALTATTGPESTSCKENMPAGTSISTAPQLSDLEITWLGISSNLRARPPESNVLVHPESLAQRLKDKGQCERAWRLASLLAFHLTSDLDGGFGPIFLFGTSFAPGIVDIPQPSCELRRAVSNRSSRLLVPPVQHSHFRRALSAH